MTVYTMRFRAVNRDVFISIKRGKKKVETRAATPRYQEIAAGDTLRFVCGKEEFQKKVKSAQKFSSIRALLREYEPREINQKTKTESELRRMYASYPRYSEKLKKFGLLAFRL
ncbi:MAG TPA: hypothetical protein VJ837_02765 [Candidatus Paceibacterota bacterium]|nr:hypothetical protein [Candidatus Paceibacterota bacterium]